MSEHFTRVAADSGYLFSQRLHVAFIVDNFINADGRGRRTAFSQHLEQPASYIACPAAAEVRIVAQLPTQTACSRQAFSTTPWKLD